MSVRMHSNRTLMQQNGSKTMDAGSTASLMVVGNPSVLSTLSESNECGGMEAQPALEKCLTALTKENR